MTTNDRHAASDPPVCYDSLPSYRRSSQHLVPAGSGQTEPRRLWRPGPFLHRNCGVASPPKLTSISFSLQRSAKALPRSANGKTSNDVVPTYPSYLSSLLASYEQSIRIPVQHRQFKIPKRDIRSWLHRARSHSYNINTPLCSSSESCKLELGWRQWLEWLSGQATLGKSLVFCFARCS